jgi:hypothetical protein
MHPSARFGILIGPWNTRRLSETSVFRLVFGDVLVAALGDLRLRDQSAATQRAPRPRQACLGNNRVRTVLTLAVDPMAGRMAAEARATPSHMDGEPGD